ncbi:hypothetical protein APA_3602 [Pseudanabaena sp. lw0831]|nr:hypothetical protein APA_3602 [Pseudanabaena sp. lw0831]
MCCPKPDNNKAWNVRPKYLGIIKNPETKSVPPAKRAVQILGIYI